MSLSGEVEGERQERRIGAIRQPTSLTSSKSKINKNEADALSPLANWLRSPTDVLTFGPRAALGALLSLPQAQGRLASAAERAQELLQDPRPPLEKAAFAAKAAAEEVASFVEAGAGAEARAKSAALDVLPRDVTSALPAEFLAAVERASGGGEGGGAAAAASSETRKSNSRNENDGDTSSSVLTPSDADRAAEEAATLASAAARVSEAADALAAAARSGGGGPRVGMARLNAREARAALARALEQAGSASPSPQVEDAARLLDELDEALLPVAG